VKPSDFLLVCGKFSGFRCQGYHVRLLGLGDGYALVWESLGLLCEACPVFGIVQVKSLSLFKSLSLVTRVGVGAGD
jgi:hypothetical protein